MYIVNALHGDFDFETNTSCLVFFWVGGWVGVGGYSRIHADI